MLASFPVAHTYEYDVNQVPNLMTVIKIDNPMLGQSDLTRDFDIGVFKYS